MPIELGLASATRALALLLERRVKAGSVDPDPVLGGELDRQVHGEAIGVVQAERNVTWQDRCVGRQIVRLHATDLLLSTGDRDKRLLEVNRARLESPREL